MQEEDYEPSSGGEDHEDSDFEEVKVKTPKKSPSRPRKRAKKETKSKEESNGTTADIEDLLKNKDFESQEQIQNIRAELLKWYDANHRKLPWRTTAKSNEERRKKEVQEDGDDEATNNVGYAVWVSEIMLQQTRVETVIDYFNRWMAKWPTIASLAKASLEEVNEAWKGLGYYRRAKFLHQGATLLMEKHDGILPRTVDGLNKIPGIGDYTAGAIASIAFGQVTPLVDGNVIRVLSRLRAISADPKNKLTVKLYWKLAGDLVDPMRPGCFNQSLMELGATVCTPQPKCSSCPVSDYCAAFAEAEAAKEDPSSYVVKYPIKVQKAKQREETVFVCIVQRNGTSSKDDKTKSEASFLLIQRPASGLLASLWEFPTVSVSAEDSMQDKKRNMFEYLKEFIPGQSESIISAMVAVGETNHLFSHIKQKLEVTYLYLDNSEVEEEAENENKKEKEIKTEKAKGKRKLKEEKEEKEKTTKKRKRQEKEDKEGKVERGGKNWRWVRESELEGAAISKGMQKCFGLAKTWRGLTKKQQQAKTKVKGETEKKKQTSLDSFFGKKK